MADSFNPWRSPVFFLAVWSLSTVIYQSIGGYWSSVITTVERIFHISTSQSGFLTAFDYFMGLWITMPLVYFGQSRHRPRFIGAVTILTSFGALVQTFPHLLYKPSLEEYLNGTGAARSSALCGRTEPSRVFSEADEGECEGIGEMSSLLNGPTIWLIIGRIMTSSYGSVFPIAIVYLDDGVPKKSIVLYTGFITTIYAIGFTCGYFLASLCLKVPYVLLRMNDDVDTAKLPGAWWLGYLLLSVLTFLTSLLFFAFPAALPVPAEEGDDESKPLVSVEDPRGDSSSTTSPPKTDNFVSLDEDRESKSSSTTLSDVIRQLWEGTKEFFRSIVRIVSNPVILLICLSGGIFIFGTEAFATFTPLYVQNHFNISPSIASVITGIQAFFGYVIGQLLGAILIRHLNLSRLQCAIFYLVGLTIYCFGPTISGFIRCPDDHIVGYNWGHSRSAYPSSIDCHSGCSCRDVFNPVCGIDGVSYLSPCHAGCREVTFHDERMVFSNCSCVESLNYYHGNEEVQEGLCRELCPTWIYYGVVGIIACFVISAANNAPVVVILRSVAEKDRALTFTFINLTYRVLGFIPGPFIFGIILDQACLIYSGSCGDGLTSSGDCLLYDKQTLRKLYFGVPSVCFWTTCIVSIFIVIIIRRQTKAENDKQAGTPEADESSAT